MEQVKETEERLERAKRLIRAMLARTEENGCTEAEAMESASKIGAMLQQYDLELTDVIVNDVSDMLTREVYAADFNMATVITGIGRLCSLKVYSKSGETVATYVLFGHAPDMEMALYLYEVCAEAADHGWQVYMDRNGYSKKARESFRVGFGHRVCDRLTQLRAQRDEEARQRAMRNPNGTGTNLVVLKDQIVEAEFEKTGIRLVKRHGPTIANRAAYGAGQTHGERVNLSNPLGGTGAQAALG